MPNEAVSKSAEEIAFEAAMKEYPDPMAMPCFVVGQTESERKRIAYRKGFAAGRASLEGENARLKWIVSQYKAWGASDCNSCDTGRVTLFYTTGHCIVCKPEDYVNPHDKDLKGDT